jgi:TP901 family phage tail tape measure protein
MAFNLGTIWAEIAVNTKKLDEGLMKAQVKLAAADKEITTMGQKLTLASTKMMVAGGIMAGAVAAVGVASVKSAKEFDTSMRNVNSITKLTEKEFQNLSKDVVDMSKKLPQSAKTLAEGLYDISSSGFQGAEGMKVLEAAAKAASAGMTDTATSAKGIVAVLNAYGMEAKDAMNVADTMFATVDKGVISFEELSGGIGNVVSTAKLAGISFNELSGMIAYMTTKGVSADETMTALNRLVMSIIDPSEELTEVLKEAGYESGELAIKQLGLVGVLELMEKASGGSLTKLQKLSPEMRALKASGALLGSGFEELTKYMSDFKDTAGATQSALDEQAKSLDFQLNLLKNNVEAIKITLGRELVPEITKATKAMSGWISENDELAATLTKVIGGGVAGAGGLLLLASLVGKIRALMMSTTGSVGVISTAFVVFNGAVDRLAESLDNSDRTSGQLEGTLLRTLAPLTMLTDGMKENITIAQALADGYLSASEAGHVNILTIQKYLKLIEERKNAEKELIDEAALQRFEQLTDRLDAADKGMNDYARSTNEATKKAEEQAAALEKQKKSVDELVESIYELYNLYQSTTESAWAFEDAIKNYNEVMADSAATDREKQEALFAAQDQWEIFHLSLLKEQETVGTNIKRQEELQEEYVKSGLKAVDAGIISETAFINMAKQFDISSGEIIKWAEEMGIVLDEVTKERIIRLGLDTSGFDSSLSAAINRLNMWESKNMAAGGIVGYAHGGIIPQAAGGMVVPQTGRAIPILAHEGEMILNSSQQGNLINALWGVANGKGGGGSIHNNFYISELVVREEADVNRIADELYSIQKSKQIGVGIR